METWAQVRSLAGSFRCCSTACETWNAPRFRIGKEIFPFSLLGPARRPGSHTLPQSGAPHSYLLFAPPQGGDQEFPDPDLVSARNKSGVGKSRGLLEPASQPLQIPAPPPTNWVRLEASPESTVPQFPHL